MMTVGSPSVTGRRLSVGHTCREGEDRAVGASRHSLPVAPTFSMKLEARSPMKSELVGGEESMTESSRRV